MPMQLHVCVGKTSAFARRSMNPQTCHCADFPNSLEQNFLFYLTISSKQSKFSVLSSYD